MLNTTSVLQEASFTKFTSEYETARLNLNLLLEN